jgi:hypothetical protein
MIRKFFFILITFSSLDGKSQSDYIINNTGDTTYGKITHNVLKKPRFAANGKTITCKPEMIREYYQSNRDRLVCSRNLPGEETPIFLDVLEKGKIMLYEIETKMRTNTGTGMPNTSITSTTTTWYAQKGVQQLREIKTNIISGSRADRKDALLFLINDNAELLARFKSEPSFSFEMIRKLIQDYNRQAEANNQ